MSRKPPECKPTKDCDHGYDKCDSHCAALISVDAEVDLFKHDIDVSADVLDCNSLLDVDVEIGHDSCYT